MLVGNWRTFVPSGYTATNEASELELPLTDGELEFFEEMDTMVAEIDMAYELLDVLGGATNNKRFNQKTKNGMKPLISHLRDGGCFEDA